MVVFTAMSVSAIAQLDNAQRPNIIRVSDSGSQFAAEVRQRRLADKASGVKASVITNTAPAEQSAFEMLNQKRAERGLKPLVWSDKVAAVARMHSQNMAEFDFFSHRGIDGKLVSDRADTVGLGSWNAIGENIAFDRGYDDPIAKAIDLWLNSPAHYNNLMDTNWKESAVGIAVAPNGAYYFTQVFLRK